MENVIFCAVNIFDMAKPIDKIKLNKKRYVL